MRIESVSKTIESAFRGVKLGGGIGLFEAQAIDDYKDKEAQLLARENDEKADWARIKQDDLMLCESSLSFFDADGMRFHLPAFMLAELCGVGNGGVVFQLSQLNDYTKDRLTALNKLQVSAVIDFLKWCQEQEDYEFDLPHIKRALQNYWLKI